MNAAWVEPVILQGAHVRLEPMQELHAEGLFQAGRDAETWQFMLRGPLASPEDARQYVIRLHAQRDAGSVQPFVTMDAAGKTVLGATTYMDIQPASRGLEVGGTWLRPASRRTPVNTECKLLLFRHAFEHLEANRVQLKTDGRNLRSQKAIERTGAVKEGVLRRHMVSGDGFLRESVMYSIVREEWPAVKARLEGFLAGKS